MSEHTPAPRTTPPHPDRARWPVNRARWPAGRAWWLAGRAGWSAGRARWPAGRAGCSAERAWWPAGLAVAAVGWGAQQFTALLLFYQARLHLTATVVQVAWGLYVVGLIPGMLLGGPVSDRYGRRRVMVPTLCVSMAATVLLVLGDGGVGWLFAGRLLAGAASGAAFSSGAAWIKELSTQSTDGPSAHALGGRAPSTRALGGRAQGPGGHGLGADGPSADGLGGHGLGADGLDADGPGGHEPGADGLGVHGPSVHGPSVHGPGGCAPDGHGPGGRALGAHEPGAHEPGVQGPGVHGPDGQRPGGSAAGGHGPRRLTIATSAGFGLGPLVAGVLVQWAPAPAVLPYVPHLLLTAVALSLVLGAPETRPVHDHGGLLRQLRIPELRSRGFRRVVVPLAPWVFGTASVAMAYLPGVVKSHLGGHGLIFSAVVAPLTAFSGILAQPLARRTGGRRLLVTAMAIVVTGMLVAALAAATVRPSLVIAAAAVLGAGYGCCQVYGLIEVQRLARPHNLAGLTAAYQAVSYAGFVLSVPLAAASRAVAPAVLLLIVAGLAGLTLAWTAFQTGDPDATGSGETRAEASLVS